MTCKQTAQFAGAFKTTSETERMGGIFCDSPRAIWFLRAGSQVQCVACRISGGKSEAGTNGKEHLASVTRIAEPGSDFRRALSA